MPDAAVTTKHPYPHGALPIGTRLGEFEVRRVLGVGGFGIVYLAFDHLLEREVALKEYMPSSLVERAESMHVSLISQANADTFALGLRSFVNEARLLARFDHASLVKVHRFWEANGTAYMAMALYKGRTVRDVRIGMQVRPDEAWVRRILEPLLGALERLHGEDVFHRDIAPDNIMLEDDGRPVLLDFGAARRVITDRSQALTAILKPSYAPIEQYADVGGMKQGAWTDIYALGATMHFLLLGKPPPPAPGRSIQDTMPPLASQALEGCTPEFLELIDWMLNPLPNERPQSVGVVREALAGRVKPPSRAGAMAYERTAPLEGPAAESEQLEATIVIPRGPAGAPSRPLPPMPSDEATVIVPRSGNTSYASQLRTGMPMPPQAPRPPVADEDATIVTPHRTGFQAPAPAHPATQALASTPEPTVRRTALPPVEPPPATVHQPMPTSIERTMHVPRTEATAAAPRPPAAPPATPASKSRSASWLVPVLAGVLVAASVGGGLWWFLTRPMAPAVLADVTPAPASGSTTPVATPAPAPEPTPQPAPATTVAASPAAVEPPAPSPVIAPAPPAEPPATTAPVNRPPVATPPPQRRNDPPPSANNRPAPAPYNPTTPSNGASPAGSSKPPVGQTPVPVPAPTPAPEGPKGNDPAGDDNSPKSPSERCANELPLVRLICVDLVCNRSAYAKHPECLKLRATQAQRRHLEGN
jgi:serine/threonine protein kinase